MDGPNGANGPHVQKAVEKEHNQDLEIVKIPHRKTEGIIVMVIQRNEEIVIRKNVQ